MSSIKPATSSSPGLRRLLRAAVLGGGCSGSMTLSPELVLYPLWDWLLLCPHVECLPPDLPVELLSSAAHLKCYSPKKARLALTSCPSQTVINP